MHARWPDFDELEVGFPEQRALFDLLTALNDGRMPPVIDSDDLLEDPAGITAAWCEAVGIPFIAEALSWQAGGDPSEHSWWDGGSFHANLAQSTGCRNRNASTLISLRPPNGSGGSIGACCRITSTSTAIESPSSGLKPSG